MTKTYLISMAIALNIDERDSRMEKITIRKQQYIYGINKLSEYMPLSV